MDRIRSGVNLLLGATLALLTGGATAQTVTTFAGSGVAGGANGVGVSATFAGPAGVAAGPAGSVFVADTGNSRIRKIGPDGSVSTFADFGAGYPNHPAGVAVDGLGSVWEVDPIGDGIDGGNLIALSADGHVLATSLQWPSVPLPPLYFDSAIAIATDWSGNLYATSYLSGVLRFDTKGKGSVLATGLPSAQGIAVDGSGNVFIADTDRNRIVKVTADGAVTALAGSGARGSADGPGAAASFAGPQGVAVDGAGTVYVADTGNHRIRQVAPDGVVSTLAGSGSEGRGDGFASAASFSSPRGIASDGHGNLYVADTGNNLIRRIALEAGGCAAGCTNWFVPSAARTPGAGGAFWTTDLVLHNRGSVPVSTTLKFLGHDTDGSNGPEKLLTLEPRQTLTYADVLSSAFGLQDGYGAVALLTSSFEVSVRSRTATARDGGTVGDGAPGFRQGSFFSDQTSPAPVLTGLHEDERFRTNLVLVNGSPAPIDVLVTAYDAAGAVFGLRTYTLPPFGMTQDSRFLGRGDFGGGPKTDATVAISSPTPGALFTACAIVIDNASNSPTTVLPQ
jgi:sugar lactone lactonase YvrE